MTEQTELSPAEAPAAIANPAVARCCDAYDSVYQGVCDIGESRVAAILAAHKAFRKAMPPLSGSENIRDFIACVAQGMLLGCISGSDGARFLYAAQVANGALRSQAPKSKAS
jgi:hypothetical protein